jgi:hypothetical protein
VIAVLVDDQPGGIHKIAKAFAARNINIEDAFGFAIREKEKGVLILDVEEMPQALETVAEAGFTILDDADLYNL